MDDIGSWLTALGLEEYIDVFRRQEIDLQSVVLLSERDLQELGVTLGARKKILNAIASRPSTDFPDQPKTDMPAAERRHLTILFCDLVASTEYADHLDPEDFRQLVEKFLRTCSEILQRHRGLVASYVGDAVNAYFGYPVADEDDAERALLAGFEILEAVPRIMPSHKQPLRVRLGIASGQVVVGNFLGAPAGVSVVAFGHVAHLAARLQTLAEPNTMLTDVATFEAANGAITFVDFGRHMLKGFSDPVQVWKARRARVLPSRFAKRTRLTKLCGRDTEVERLNRIWEEILVTRRGRAAVISGEAGIGKSRLLYELQKRIQAPDQLVLQCSPAFESSTLYPFLTALKRRAGVEDTDAVADKMRKLKATLSISEIPTDVSLPIFAGLLSIPVTRHEAAREISSERQRAITAQVFIEWLQKISQKSDLLLIFEDEQWADSTSRELLSALINQLASIPALILVSTRTEIEAEIPRNSEVLQLKLDVLETQDATALINDMSPAESPSEELVRFVLDRAEGVPLYIEELTRSALEVGLPTESPLPHSRSKEGNIPTSLQSSLLARLDRLGSAKEVAQIAATIGREFDLGLLLEASGLSRPAVEDALTNLIRSSLILPKEGAKGASFLFKHALLQQAAQQTILRERRQELHALIGATMERRDPEASSAYPELLAQHFTEGKIFDRAADYWLLAGLKAAKTWAKAEAARMFGRGIEAAKKLPDSRERSSRILRLELERGDVLYAAFGYVTGEGSTAYHRAIRLSEELEDSEASIRALDGLFGTHFNSGEFSESIEASERLIEIGENRDSLKALVLGLQFKGMSLFCRGQLTSARLYLERALSHRTKANEVGSDFPSMAMIYLSWTMEILGNHTEALKLFRGAERIVRKQPAYRLAACLGDGCILFAFREESAAIARLTEELLPLAREHGFNLWTNMAQFFQGWTMADIDKSISGTSLMQDTVRALKDQEVDKTCFLGLLGKAYLRTGQFERAEAMIRQGLEQSNKIGEHYYTAELLRLRGEIELCRGGDRIAAEASFREAIVFAQGQSAVTWEKRAVKSLARLHSKQGRHDESRCGSQ